MTQVMKECDRLKASSVAIPSIGAGNLGFPPDVVARIMVGAVSTYLDQNRRTSVTKVSFVIFDKNILEHFKTENVSRPSPVRSDPSPRSSKTSFKPRPTVSMPSIQPQISQAASHIDVKKGSLTDINVSSIAQFAVFHVHSVSIYYRHTI